MFAEQILLVGTRKVISGGVDFDRKNAKNGLIARNIIGIVCRAKGFASRDWHIRFLRGAIRGMGSAG